MLTEVLLFIVLLLIISARFPWKPERLPPGPWGWPIIGVLPKKGISIARQVEQLHKKHGDVILWRIGARINIFLCSHKVIKEVFSKAETVDRPDMYIFQSAKRFTNDGLVNNGGISWHRNRRFTLRHLKDLGLGKSILEEKIQHEAAQMIKSFKKQVGSTQPLPWSINVAVVNVIWQIVAGQRYETDNPRIINLHKTSFEMFKACEGSINYLDTFPWLIPILPHSIKKLLGMTQVLEKFNKIHSSFTDVIEEHLAKLDPNDPRDFIDDYLVEMKNEESNSNDHMSIRDLEVILTDLFVAGSDTVSNSIRWGLIYLTKYAEVQKKVQQEIDSVVPRDRLPSLQDKKSLPYTEAVTFEIHRIISLSIMGVPHYASKDFEVNGYIIPRGSILHSHLTLCNFDPEHWTNPKEFRPERFLNDNGECLPPKEGFAPFSVGRRVCVGEPLAKMEFFLFLSSIMQTFTFLAPEGEELSTERDPNERFLNLPRDVQLIIQERK